MEDPRDYEVAHLQDVKDASTEIINSCVTPLRQGGVNNLGLGNRLQVMIYQESEDDENLSDTDPSKGTCSLQKAEANEEVTDCYLGGIASGSGGG